MPVFDIAVVGAGPAGLIAAERLATAGHRVTVYDRMPSPARKLLMAGRGGLNLTHSEPLEAFLRRYGRAAPQLASMIEAFPPEALRDWAGGLGEETFVGSSGRVFPKTLKASPLLRAWLRRLESLGVRLELRQQWIGVEGTALRFRSADGGETEIRPAATLLALGGASWPRLGSDGSWVAILQGAGIALSPLEPANSGFAVKWSAVFADRFAGAPLKTARFQCDATSMRGEAMVTRYGIEGGAIYALSSAIRQAQAEGGDATLTIDLLPDLSRDEAARRIAAQKPGQSLSNLLRKALRLPPVSISLLRETSPAGLPRDAEGLSRSLKAIPLLLGAPSGIERAISTAGGVAWDALDERLMLKALPGVFAAGEMLDWEAPTGGYLLQACFATGVRAADGMLEWLRRPATA